MTGVLFSDSAKKNVLCDMPSAHTALPSEHKVIRQRSTNSKGKSIQRVSYVSNNSCVCISQSKHYTLKAFESLHCISEITYHINIDLANVGFAVLLFEVLDPGLFFGDKVCHNILQILQQNSNWLITSPSTDRIYTLLMN